jgi:6-phosphofructokinase 1
MIRAIPSNASDNIYCSLLAQSAVHGAMAGYTGFTVGPVNSRHAYIPIAVSTSSSQSLFMTNMTFYEYSFTCWFTLVLKYETWLLYL